MERTTTANRAEPPSAGASSRDRTNAHDVKGIVEKLRATASQTFEPEAADLVRRALDAALTHPSDATGTALRVASLLVAQHADAPLAASLILGPLRTAGKLSAVDVEQSHGAEVAALVDEVRRVARLRTGTEAELRDDCADLLRSTASDLRVVVARVAMRIIDLEHPRTTNEKELRELANEALDLLVPMADRVGLGALRGMLEDACFRVLEPDLYRSIERAVAGIQRADEVCLDLLREKVAILLRRGGVDAEIHGRTKSLWGIHRKMQARDLPVDRIMDRLGLRVIVGSVPECYAVLGLLHTHFRPIPGTFDDYVGLPKENGYQSLHTCVYPVRSISLKSVEFQVRTRAMHLEAEFGVAAHWRYKSEAETHDEQQRQLRWFRDLSAHQDASDSHEAFVAQLTKLVYQQSLVVFLRGGQQVRMPADSSARDLIYKISERPASVGSVVINAQEKPLETALRDGDTVEWNEEVPSYHHPHVGLFEFERGMSVESGRRAGGES